MKNLILVFIAVASLISFMSFVPSSSSIQINLDMGNEHLMADNRSGLAVVSYRVEERINMNFGGRITTYVVPSLNMVRTCDLGGNNSRRITPKYGKVKLKVMMSNVLAIAPINATPIVLKEIKVDLPKLLEKKKYVNINFIDTYERVLEKGYRSADMLKRAANARFFLR
jgi:hypothetical protein